MNFTSEISLKIRTAIKVKLAELGNDVYEELPDYIMVMVANRRGREQMTEDLSLFLGDNTRQFTTWLHSLLSKLQSVASVSSEERQASGSAEDQSSKVGATPSPAQSHSDRASEHSNDEDASSAALSGDEASKAKLQSKEAEDHSDASPKRDSSSPDNADSTSRGSNNKPSAACDSDSHESDRLKTDNGTSEIMVRKRKKHSKTRNFRVKSRKVEPESDSNKSNTVSSSKPTSEQGTDASDSEKETKSYTLTQIRKMKQNTNSNIGSEVSSSLIKTQLKEQDSSAEGRVANTDDTRDQEVENDMDEEVKKSE